MGSFQNHTTIKRTRKDHRCDECHLAIPKGVSCEIDSGVYDGDFYSVRMHTECREEYFRINAGCYDEEQLPLDQYESESGEAGYWEGWQSNIKEKYGLRDEQVGPDSIGESRGGEDSQRSEASCVP